MHNWKTIYRLWDNEKPLPYNIPQPKTIPSKHKTKQPTTPEIVLSIEESILRNKHVMSVTWLGIAVAWEPGTNESSQLAGWNLYHSWWWWSHDMIIKVRLPILIGIGKTLHHIIKTWTSTRMTTVVTSVVQYWEILSDMVRNPLRWPDTVLKKLKLKKDFLMRFKTIKS